jgi:hypothetical protein
MGNTTELDKDLVDGLHAAKTKRCYFALVLKGGTDGALLVSKTKIPPTAIADAKKSSGGSAVLEGFVSFADGAYLFETAKIPPATATQTVKTIAKRDAGLAIHADFRMGTDPELAGVDGGHGAQVTPITGTAQTAPQMTPETSPHGPLPEAAKYATALQEWEQAAAAALSATDELITALDATDDDLADAIAQVVEQLKADFPDTLDDALTNLAASAKAGKASETESYRNKSEIAIKAALAYLGNNAHTIEGCEHNPFGISISFRAPLTESLKQVLLKVKK